MDDELDRFKREIDLRSYAAGQGYHLDAKESWRGSAVMRHPVSDDKIIIKRNANGHYVYFSVRDDDDNGTIIDFVQNRQGLSLGTVRKELRPWVGCAPVPVPHFAALPHSAKDRSKVELEYARMQDAGNHLYLETDRAIPAALLRSDRFAGRVRMDDYGNAIFPHFDLDGLCGYEIKNRNFTGFAKHGAKGLWLSHGRADDNRLVLAESGIDGLSHAELFPNAHARYGSIGGKPNPQQPELIRALIVRLPSGSEVVSATDNDADGVKLAGVVEHAVKASGRDDLRFLAHQPVAVKDWNDALREKQPRLSLPIARPSSLDVA